jgi:IS30 family transposase
VGLCEGDAVIEANQKQAIVTAVERKSGYLMIAKVENKTSDLVGSSIVGRLNPFGEKVITLTFDNFNEFCGYGKIDEALGSTSYFARPFSRLERGSNKNFNGLLQ